MRTGRLVMKFVLSIILLLFLGFCWLPAYATEIVVVGGEITTEARNVIEQEIKEYDFSTPAKVELRRTEIEATEAQAVEVLITAEGKTKSGIYQIGAQVDVESEYLPSTFVVSAVRRTLEKFEEVDMTELF